MKRGKDKKRSEQMYIKEMEKKEKLKGNKKNAKR